MDALHILIVEDSDAVSMAIAKMVRPLIGHFPDSKVTIVTSLRAALKIIFGEDQAAPDITILDLNLDDAAMGETVTHLDSIADHTPLVIISGMPRHVVESEIRRAGQTAQTVIEKAGDLFFGREFLWQIIDVMRFWRRKKEQMSEARLTRIHEALESLKNAQ